MLGALVEVNGGMLLIDERANLLRDGGGREEEYESHRVCLRQPEAASTEPGGNNGGRRVFAFYDISERLMVSAVYVWVMNIHDSLADVPRSHYWDQTDWSSVLDRSIDVSDIDAD